MSLPEKISDIPLNVYSYPEISSSMDLGRQEAQNVRVLTHFEKRLWEERVTSVFSKMTSVNFWEEKFQNLFFGSNSNQNSLGDSYQQCVDLAHEGKFDKVRSRWMTDLERCQTPEQWTYVMENLCWLDLFSENISSLEINATLLLQHDPHNPMALYSLAYTDFLKKDYQSAQEYLTTIKEAQPLCSDILAYQINDLERRIGIKTEQNFEEESIISYTNITNETVDLMMTDERGRYTNYTAYKNWTQRSKADQHLGNIEISSYQKFETQVLSLLQSGKIQKSELPELAHLYFRTSMNYVADLSLDGFPGSRTLDQSFTTKEYDCTEYTEGIARVLNAAKIPAVQIRYQQGWLNGKPVYHGFVAYQLDGKWGYLSPTRTSEPRFISLKNLAASWEWDNYGEKFEVGRLSRKSDFAFSQL